ncbi:hypothetical protein CFAM422_006641 [Trichoderma lentiforme]|uniref:Uncharacterized protein n=1 Tax=Trichoderma lentiforme TaxID=1567552 RepID=A0A9P4XE32_9HYPO|nr:hypothetical protein CFAM422_006641 [Trichoderma lentiforme]
MPLMSFKLVGRLSRDFSSQDDTESISTCQGAEQICSNRVARTVTSDGQVQPSANTCPNETDQSLIGKIGGEGSNNSIPKNINRGLGVSESVEGQVANTFRRLSPHVRARSIRDRDAWLARVNAQRKQWPFAD